MPSTSPRRTLKLTSFDEQLARDVRVFDRHVARLEDDLAALVLGLGEDVADLAADHPRDDARLVEFCGVGRVPTVRPSRRTVMRSETRKTSSSLCEM